MVLFYRIERRKEIRSSSRCVECVEPAENPLKSCKSFHFEFCGEIVGKLEAKFHFEKLKVWGVEVKKMWSCRWKNRLSAHTPAGKVEKCRAENCGIRIAPDESLYCMPRKSAGKSFNCVFNSLLKSVLNPAESMWNFGKGRLCPALVPDVFDNVIDQLVQIAVTLHARFYVVDGIYNGGMIPSPEFCTNGLKRHLGDFTHHINSYLSSR